MTQRTAPAFYALGSTARWKEYLNLLHAPYTTWHLSYVLMGAAVAPTLHLDRLLGTLLAFFLGVGICSHALDELNGRPLGTRIPTSILGLLAAVSLAGAIGLGVIAAIAFTLWLLPFVVFGMFIALAYNLGLWRGRFHSDLWFAFAWGAFPVLTSYWVNAGSLGVSAMLVAGGCFGLSYAQRTLSTQARTIRRKAVRVVGSIEMADGQVVELDREYMIVVSERALQILSLTVVVLALGLLTSRL